ncbi:MAG: hypothetical protein EHM93_09170 [Bacteroidales bacterium]|nr:MAG: hypothetical protein EHM93_09170 [Bacteroidales bacterium]
MKTLYFVFLSAIMISCSNNPKGSVRVQTQSKVYKIVDEVYSLKKLNGNDPNERYDVDKTIKIDTGLYILRVPFHAKAGIFYNDGAIEDTILIKKDKRINVFLVGGDLAGMFASDPKLEIEE